ncbi:MAG: hypothetical protein COV52_01875 [Gammaproteobacteria bacterium CG11_big_fil_rev_8_21_14_0_20_46_22]|nr:MAG: hypothetical protein COW05_05770 [Gammaproteobacteria bacterium CG12_big_fil_rev_8_21_14_0_65_46_12]PIR11863.1 MAG: hypothetical protein COV52_01875 [Gammaproteobacteria bacterium CG11_big_fil_rev_8_21_14_0_20_46_22]
MLLFKNNWLRANSFEKPVDSELYQQRFDLHQHNACARVKDTGLIYDAIKLAQYKSLNKWAWQKTQAENHPALLKLCAFWECFQEDTCEHEARIPYIQLFFGNEVYTPLIPDGAVTPLKLNDDSLQQNLKHASVIFGNEFLVTYLAGRHVTARQSEKEALIYYTVHDEPLLKERLIFSEMNLIAFDQQNQLAWQVLKALHEFPKRFPTLWKRLKKQHEVNSYEIH